MAHTLDDDRFNKAKALHTELTSPPTLQELCMDFYLENAGALVSEWKESGENFFDLFPNNLKIDLLKYLLEEGLVLINSEHTDDSETLLNTSALQLELTYMLMNPLTVKLDYKEYSKSTSRLTSVDEFWEILAHAAQNCPKLEHLAVRGHRKRKPWEKLRFPARAEIASPINGIGYLLQLQDLRHLEIVGIWYWTDDGLDNLFTQLKKLVFLKLWLHKNVTVRGFDNIHLLKDLEEFHFVVRNPDEGVVSNRFALIYEWIYGCCAEKAPSLKLIGATTEECAGNFMRDLGSSSDLRNITPKIMGTSMLEHLHTNLRLPEADFPNLQHLYFRGRIYENLANKDELLKKFGTFTHLTELNLCDLTSGVVAQMLELVGKQLSTLTIDAGEPVDFYQVLYLCPNLVSFRHSMARAWTNNKEYTKYQALVTKHNVRLLDYFEAELESGPGIRNYGPLLNLLLFAPLIQVVKLFHYSMTGADCQALDNVLEGCFPHLRHLVLEEMEIGPSCSMNDFGLFVQCLVCSAPYLNYFDFTWEDEVDNNEWELDQTIAQSFQELVNKERPLMKEWGKWFS